MTERRTGRAGARPVLHCGRSRAALLRPTVFAAPVGADPKIDPAAFSSIATTPLPRREAPTAVGWKCRALSRCGDDIVTPPAPARRGWRPIHLVLLRRAFET